MSSYEIKSEVLRIKPSAQFLNISVASLYRLADSDPLFPNKIRFSKRCVGYRRRDLEAYLEAKAEVGA